MSLLIDWFGWWNLPVYVLTGKFVTKIWTASHMFISKIITIFVILGRLKFVRADIPSHPTLFRSKLTYTYLWCTFWETATVLWLNVPHLLQLSLELGSTSMHCFAYKSNIHSFVINLIVLKIIVWPSTYFDIRSVLYWKFY